MPQPSTDSEYFAGPLICDLCDRRAEGDAWPTHPEFGFRYCPVCKVDGFTLIPRLMSNDEVRQWNDGNTGW